MSYDDFDVIVYKLLSYLYECLKNDITPNAIKAQEIAKCNNTYFAAVIKSLKQDGYVTGNFTSAWGGDIVTFDISITQSGARYLSEDSQMEAVSAWLGKAFSAILEAAIKATIALSQ